MSNLKDCYMDYAQQLRKDAERMSFVFSPDMNRTLIDLIAALANEVDCLNKEMKEVLKK
jgi:hypothetical protein